MAEQSRFSMPCWPTSIGTILRFSTRHPPRQSMGKLFLPTFALQALCGGNKLGKNRMVPIFQK
jgi:hypothetical protein